MKLNRSSGLLLHPTSLPGKFGIGEIGKAAYRWIDFLVEAKQSVWQILPLGPTSYGDSPYQTMSVFAGNPLLIDLQSLSMAGYISTADLKNAPKFQENKIDYKTIIDWKIPLLLEAYAEFLKKARKDDITAFENFCQKYHSEWLDEFALFMALKNNFGGKAWNQWPIELKLRKIDALKEMRFQLKQEIHAQKFLQYLFLKQWQEVKEYANSKGVAIMGDIPIYVTYDSADVWANQDKYCLDNKGALIEVAGVPPDYFSDTGQLWGNPIYKWDLMAKNGFKWWIERVRTTLEYVDIIRIDHFRGFEAYWTVPYGEDTAINGEWKKGPGYKFFDRLMTILPEVPIIAEDLGVITPEVVALRDRYGFPGMKILHFAFSSNASNRDLPHNYDARCIVYAGTHDNDTTLGWFKTLPEHEKTSCIEYLNKKPLDISWELMRLASASTAVLAIFTVQDVLSLGNEARMNFPGKPSGNWSWRLKSKQLTKKHAARLANMTNIYGRANSTL